jgi:hypothetical protein
MFSSFCGRALFRAIASVSDKMQYVPYNVRASTGARIVHRDCFAGCGFWAHPVRANKCIRGKTD